MFSRFRRGHKYVGVVISEVNIREMGCKLFERILGVTAASMLTVYSRFIALI